MKKVQIITLLIVVMLLCIACGKDDQNDVDNNKEQIVDRQVVIESMTGECGYILENNIFDYSDRFEITYDWTEGVRLPFEKMEKSEVIFDENDLIIRQFDEEEVEAYISSFEADGYKILKFERETHNEGQLTRYVVYKDNLVILFDRYEERINVYLLAGNVGGDREVSIDKLKELLLDQQDFKQDEMFSEYIVVEMSNESLMGEYCEFLIISPNYYDFNIEYDEPYYVIANKNGINLCKKGVWNQAYPMSVNLISSDEETKLIINTNELPGSRSGANVYPVEYIYSLVNGKFENVSTIELQINEVVLGKIEEDNIQFYIMKKNESWNLKQGRKDYWVINKKIN